MFTRPLSSRCRKGFTLTEMLMASAAGLLVLSGLASTATNLRRSMAATDHYAQGSGDGSRLLDYVVQDLRRAVGVGTLEGGIHTPLKNNAVVTVSGGTTLTINIPDFYASNNPDGGANPAFRQPRYSSDTLNSDAAFQSELPVLKGTVRWEDAVTGSGAVETTRFSPASLGLDEVQVRYYRVRRSAADATLCYFRSEHSPGANTPNFPPEEVAGHASFGGGSAMLVIEAPNRPLFDPKFGKIFHVRAAFQPRFRRAAGPVPSVEQTLTVLVRNGRRD